MNNTIPFHDEITGEYITLELTTRCNGYCPFCFAGSGSGGGIDMTVTTAEAILDEARCLGYRNLHCTGGEPFLWRDLFPFMEKAAAAGYKEIFINTNGTSLSAEECRRCASVPATVSFSISLQGFREHHDHFRGEGSFAAALKGLENALSSGIPVTVFCSVGKTLLPELPRFSQWFFESYPNVERLVFIQFIDPGLGPFALKEELIPPEGFVLLVKTAALLNLAGHRTGILDNPLSNAVAHALGMPWLPRSLHLHRPARLVVRADGSITMSHSTPPSLGHYGERTLKDILSSPEYASGVGECSGQCDGCFCRDDCRRRGILHPTECKLDQNENVPYCRRVMELVLETG